MAVRGKDAKALAEKFLQRLRLGGRLDDDDRPTGDTHGAVETATSGAKAQILWPTDMVNNALFPPPALSILRTLFPPLRDGRVLPPPTWRAALRAEGVCRSEGGFLRAPARSPSGVPRPRSLAHDRFPKSGEGTLPAGGAEQGSTHGKISLFSERCDRATSDGQEMTLRGMAGACLPGKRT